MQLDFLSYTETKPNEQLSFLDEKNRIHIKKHNKEDVEKFFASITEDEIIDHSVVWERLKPTNDVDVFQRWLFAFCSVHTSYESNMRGYLAIKDFTEWFNKDDVLFDKLKGSGVGLYNNRTKFISEFAQKYWQNPNLFKFKKNQKWAEFRDGLVKDILGLGLAKVSFALEMIYTFDCGVFCCDTHLFQAYGYDQQLHLNKYRELENHWIEFSSMYNVPSAIARAIYWNRKKGENDCSYWADVLDNNKNSFSIEV
jgi:thermostable 8-oxoguanine DNA glycosylase